MDIAVKNDAAVEEYERIFEQYLNICNQAIEKNKDKFPYMEIWKARWKNLVQDNIVRCAIYDDRPKVAYVLQLTEDMQIKILEKTHTPLEDVWPFKYTYLKHVVDNRQEYIEHPANLDWGWLTRVFG